MTNYPSMQFAHVSYDLIPEHMRDSLRRYVEYGDPVGGFLTNVLSNDLVHSYGSADHINTAAMRNWAEWLWNECPSLAWGSPEKVREWQLSRREFAASGSKPCADCDSGAENIAPHDCTNVVKVKA